MAGRGGWALSRRRPAPSQGGRTDMAEFAVRDRSEAGGICNRSVRAASRAASMNEGPARESSALQWRSRPAAKRAAAALVAVRAGGAPPAGRLETNRGRVNAMHTEPRTASRTEARPFTLRTCLAFLLGLAQIALSANASAQEPAAGAGAPRFAPVTWERLVNAADEPHNWLMYNGTLDSRRFSRLDQIDTTNVADLELKWAYTIRQLDRTETTPLVVDGVMFITESPSNLTAVDATDGRPYWRYEHPLPDDLRICCGRNNRGVAILGETLYMSTLDAHLVAIDARSGSVVWDSEVADYRGGYSKTAAPLIVKDRVVTGIAGGEFGIRGFLDAYDAESGDRAWRTYTIPGPDHPDNRTWSGDSWRTGGSPTWITGSYDPELDLIYWGTGNPGPDYGGDVRVGDNLYADSVLALDGDTGDMAWYFQFTPHDIHDWDAIQIPVLADIEFEGEPRRAMLWANRNAFYYTLDRETGEFLLGKPFALQTWAEGLDESGRPIRRPGTAPSLEGTVVAPTAGGGTNWWSPAYSPRTGLLYVNAFDGEGQFFVRDEQYEAGERYTGGGVQAPQPMDNYQSAIRAIDPASGDIRWEFPMKPRARSGVLATAGGLVFAATVDGYFFALDAAGGEELWRIPLGGAVNANPMTYAVGGAQYVTMAVGNTVYTFGLHE